LHCIPFHFFKFYFIAARLHSAAIKVAFSLQHLIYFISHVRTALGSLRRFQEFVGPCDIILQSECGRDWTKYSIKY